MNEALELRVSNIIYWTYLMAPEKLTGCSRVPRLVVCTSKTVSKIELKAGSLYVFGIGKDFHHRTDAYSKELTMFFSVRIKAKCWVRTCNETKCDPKTLINKLRRKMLFCNKAGKEEKFF
jgi:hypothetical protein